MSDYSLIELHPRSDGLHEIVGTGFNNLAMPLVRYRTGDMVEKDEPSLCPCGRRFPRIRRVHGRADDSIKLPDGSLTGRLDRIFDDAAGVIEGQLVQEQAGLVEVLVVPGSSYSDDDRSALIEALRRRTGEDLTIRVRLVPALSRSRSGKVRNVICMF